MASKLVLFACFVLATIFLFSSQALARDVDASAADSDEKTWKKLGHKIPFPKGFKHPKLPEFPKFEHKGHEGLPKIHVKKPDGSLFKKFPHFKFPKVPFPFKGLPKPKFPKFGEIPHHP